MSSARRALFLLLVAMLLLLFVATRPAQAQAASHVVQRGETLYSIAQRYGLTVSQLASANNIVNPNLIYPGQELLLPDATEAVSEEDAAEAASGTPPVAVSEHVVQRGESLMRIAALYGVTVDALQRYNQLANPNLIFPGQRLTIPAAGAPGPSPEPAPPPAAAVYKRIVVDKSEQRAYVYQNGELLWTFVISTGMPGSETWEGTFAVRSKIPNAYAYLWGLQMPYWLGFYHTGYLENGFHALPILPSGAILWDGYLGTPVSYGCVILSYPDAETLYNWAEIGTEVVVQW